MQALDTAHCKISYEEHIEFENNFFDSKNKSLFYEPRIEISKYNDTKFNETTNCLKIDQNLKIPNEFQNLNSFLKQNVKIFINKLRNHLNYKLLNSSQYNYINDLAYFESENKDNNQKGTKIVLFLSEILAQFYQKYLNKVQSFHPYHNFKIIWDIFNGIIIIFFIFYIPLSIALELNIIHMDVQINYFYFIYMIIDMMIQMNTLYFENGIEVHNKFKMMKYYVNSNFASDLIGFMSLLISFVGRNYFLIEIFIMFELFYLIKFFSLIEINRRLMHRFEFGRRSKGIKDLFSLFFCVLLIIHCLACFWIFISNQKYFPQARYQNTWLTKLDLENADWYLIYIYASYWGAITVMTVGYGDITPSNPLETLFTYFTVMFGCMVFAYIINSLGSIIHEINKNKTRFMYLYIYTKVIYFSLILLYSLTLDVINSYMRRKKINIELQTKIREYLKFIWKQKSFLNVEEEEKIINSLSSSLKEELLIESFGYFLKNNEFFTNNFSDDALRKTVFAIKEISFTPEDVIYSVSLDNKFIYINLKLRNVII